MKNKILLIAILGTATSVLAGPAENFARFDVDKNGTMSKAEYLAMRAEFAKKKGVEAETAKDEKAFMRKDADGNGELTLEEFSASGK